MTEVQLDPNPASSAVRLPRTPRHPLIDCDVHPYPPGGFNGLADILEYVPVEWRDRARAEALGSDALIPSVPFRTISSVARLLPTAVPPSGGAPSSDPDYIVQDHLDRYGIATALLTFAEGGYITNSANEPGYSAALATALNSYFLERFARDRLRYNLLVSPVDAEFAVAEIERHAADSRVAAVYLPTSGIRFGDGHYDPIFDACVRHALPIACHSGSADGKVQGAARFSTVPAIYPEYAAVHGTIPQTMVSSLVFSGTLERYPDLKIAFIEYGFGWILPLMWRMDRAWERNRSDLPHVKQAPSAYVRKQIRLSTQPTDYPYMSSKSELGWLVEGYLSDILMYSTTIPTGTETSPVRFWAHCLRAPSVTSSSTTLERSCGSEARIARVWAQRPRSLTSTRPSRTCTW